MKIKFGSKCYCCNSEFSKKHICSKSYAFDINNNVSALYHGCSEYNYYFFSKNAFNFEKSNDYSIHRFMKYGEDEDQMYGSWALDKHLNKFIFSKISKFELYCDKCDAFFFFNSKFELVSAQKANIAPDIYFVNHSDGVLTFFEDIDPIKLDCSFEDFKSNPHIISLIENYKLLS